MKIIVVGGGAAGIFAAIRASEVSKERVILLERTSQLLAKVKISGGGRCNVTHGCFEPKHLVENYPRGKQELLGPFFTFQPQQTIDWFESHGVPLKKEADGRMFPATNTSQTIIDTLLKAAAGVDIRLQSHIEKIEKTAAGFAIHLKDEILQCDRLLLATGSNPKGHEYARALGHTIVEPVPSLFAFNVKNFVLSDLSGVSVQDAVISCDGFQTSGPLLITHFGFSGPAILRLSAFAARFLNQHQYRTTFTINWIPSKELKKDDPPPLPKSLWKKLLLLAGIPLDKTLRDLKDKEFEKFVEKLKKWPFELDGKTTHKEEFVTAGGILLKEVNFKTMESKIVKNLYFAGEVLDVDGITGGFNFQNAWTTGWIAGSAIGA